MCVVPQVGIRVAPLVVAVRMALARLAAFWQRAGRPPCGATSALRCGLAVGLGPRKRVAALAR